MPFRFQCFNDYKQRNRRGNYFNSHKCARGICGSLTLRITLENLQNYDGNGNGKVTEQNN